MKKYLAEFIGTFMLVLCGTGVVVVNQQYGGVVSHVGVCLVWGAIVSSIIFAFGDVSGAHVNPAVTVAFWLARRFELKEVPPYLLSQAAGGIAASATLHFLFPENKLLGGTYPAGSEMQSFVMEFLVTFFLMLLIMQVSTGSKEKGMFAAVAIGSMVMLTALFAGPVSGDSMNPIRSLAPAIVSGHFEHQWIYLTSTFAGAAFAILIWHVLKEAPQPPKGA
jgi:aquaporin NIP